MIRYTPRAERADSISSICACPFVAFPLRESRMTEGFTFSKNTTVFHNTVRTDSPSDHIAAARPVAVARVRERAILHFGFRDFPGSYRSYRYFDNRIPRDGHSYRTRYRARHGHNASELRSSMCCSQPMVIFYSTHPRYHRYAVISSCSHGSTRLPVNLLCQKSV